MLLDLAQEAFHWFDPAALWIGRGVMLVWASVTIWFIVQTLRVYRYDRAQRRKDDAEWLSQIRLMNAELRLRAHDKALAEQPTDVLPRFDDLDFRLQDWANILGIIPTPRSTPKMKENHQ